MQGQSVGLGNVPCPSFGKPKPLKLPPPIFFFFLFPTFVIENYAKPWIIVLFPPPYFEKYVNENISFSRLFSRSLDYDESP